YLIPSYQLLLWIFLYVKKCYIGANIRNPFNNTPKDVQMGKTAEKEEDKNARKRAGKKFQSIRKAVRNLWKNEDPTDPLLIFVLILMLSLPHTSYLILYVFIKFIFSWFPSEGFKTTEFILFLILILGIARYIWVKYNKAFLIIKKSIF